MELIKPPEGKAIVYFLRPTTIGFLIKFKVFIDDKLIGFTRGRNFLYAIVDPGQHLFKTKSENTSKLELSIEPNKTYYIKQKVRIGFLIARNKMSLVNVDEGIKELNKCKPSKSIKDPDIVAKMGDSFRPLIVTILVVIGLILVLGNISSLIRIRGWYLIYLIIIMLANIVCYIGIWKMKKIAAFAYAGILVLNIIVSLILGHGNIAYYLIPAIFAGVFLYHSKKMK